MRIGRYSAVAACLLAVLAFGAVASAAGPKLSVRAAKLTKTSDTRWAGSVVSPQLGKGKLTLTGRITFNDKDADDPNSDRNDVRFRATFKNGSLRGCFVINTLLRPGNRQVWGGEGRVTSTSASLRRYRGLKLMADGATPANDRTFAKPFVFRKFEHKVVC